MRNAIFIVLMIVLYTIECIFPYFDSWFSSWKTKALHALRNIGIILFNAIFVNLLLVPLIFFSTRFNIGLFSKISLPRGFELLLTILIIDFVTYAMHVAYHKIPFLWRFHRMHHSDTQMDVTTGARFHIGEHIISTLVRCVVYVCFAIKIEYIIIYEIFFISNVLFHHANISIGKSIDKIYRIFFTSPNMHKVHHSNVQKETDSNYSSLFSFWDRVFRTYRFIENPKRIVYGLHGWEHEQTVAKMLMTPFKKKK